MHAKSVLTRGKTSALALLLIGSAVGYAADNETRPEQTETRKQVGRPTLSVKRPQAPPQVDGVLDDDCWNAAEPVALGYSTGTWWEAPSQKTEARVLAER